MKSIKTRVEELEIQIHDLEYRMDACYRKIDEQNQIINGLQTKLQGNTTMDEAVKIATEIDSLENDPNLFKEQLLEKHKIEISDIQSSEMEIHDEKTEIEKIRFFYFKGRDTKEKIAYHNSFR